MRRCNFIRRYPSFDLFHFGRVAIGVLEAELGDAAVGGERGLVVAVRLREGLGEVHVYVVFPVVGHVGAVLVFGEVAVLAQPQPPVGDAGRELELVEYNCYNIARIQFFAESSGRGVYLHQ